MGKQQGTGRTATACESPLCHGCPGCWTPGYLPYRIHISLPSISTGVAVDADVHCMPDNCHRPSGSCFLPSTDRRSVHYCTDSKSGPGRRRKWPRTINANGVESPLVPGCSFVDNPCARSASSSRLTVNSVAEGKPPDPVGRPTRLRCSDCPAPTPGVVFQSPPPWFRTRRVLGGEACLAGRVDGRPGAQFVFSPGPKTPPDQHPLFAIDRLSRPVSRTAPAWQIHPAYTGFCVCSDTPSPLGPDEKGVAQP